MSLETVKIPDGWEQVGTSGKGLPIITDGRHRKILANGGLLNADGNPGNKGGGRIADKVRLDATKSLENEVARIGGLLTLLVDRAELELEESGRLDSAIQTLNTISRVANTLTSIGPGTKVTNVVERDGYHDAASRAYDAHDGTKLDYLTKLKAELDAIP